MNWLSEGLPKLNELFQPDRQKNSDGKWLTQPEKDLRANEAKSALRDAKAATVDARRDAYVKGLADARVQDVLEKLNYPDAALKRKAMALLRHWFNRVGADDVTLSRAASIAEAAIFRLPPSPTFPRPEPILLHSTRRPSTAMPLQAALSETRLHSFQCIFGRVCIVRSTRRV